MCVCFFVCAEEEKEEDRSQYDRRANKLHPPHTHRLWRNGGGHAAGETRHIYAALTLSSFGRKEVKLPLGQ